MISYAKHILQLLWKENVDWDEPAGATFIEMRRKIKSELHLLFDLKISRWVNYRPTDVIELHGFCDASEVGYAAVIYLKNTTENTVRLLIAKSRVAPIKTPTNDENDTIPRLELCGAMLLSQLVKKVVDSLDIRFQKFCLWSDSKIVISWIRGDPKRCKTFVASRISKIHKLVDKTNWFHVISELNPADCASRGLLPSELINHPLWWSGSEFLKTETNFEQHQQDIQLVETIHELAKIKVNIAQATSSPFHHPLLNNRSFYDFKSYEEVQRYVAGEMKSPTNPDKTIWSDDLNATKKIMQTIQNESIKDEILLLKNQKTIPKSNRLIALSPWLDENDIIRMGGR